MRNLIGKWFRPLDNDDTPLTLLAVAEDAESNGYTIWSDAARRLVAAGRKPIFCSYASHNFPWSWCRESAYLNQAPEELPEQVCIRLLCKESRGVRLCYASRHGAWLDAVASLISAEIVHGKLL